MGGLNVGHVGVKNCTIEIVCIKIKLYSQRMEILLFLPPTRLTRKGTFFSSPLPYP